MTVVDDIKNRLDILEVISQYVPLHRSGRSYKANCPFHQEKTPSFFVFPDRQTWRCFGACATGGDAFSFVMRAENLEFGEVLKRLAQQAGVTLPSRDRSSNQQGIFQVNEAARGYFQRVLASSQGDAARTYLEKRGLTRQTIEKFELGLSPRNGESLKNYLVNQGFSPEQLALAGVVRSGEDGRHHDLFRGRLMVPIRNGQGELAGFGGRALDDSNPKYLNSPRTPVFDKGHILYGLHLARESARQQGIVIVEGYMDAIMAHQHGFGNVVASMGTALTEHQVAQVRRLTSSVTMALDPDAAGQQATLRSLESSWKAFRRQVVGQSGGVSIFQRQENLDLKIAVLPEGMDPDEVIRQSSEEWVRLVQDSMPLLEYLIEVLPDQMNAATPEGKARVVNELSGFLAEIPEPIVQDHHIQMLAARLGVREETLRASIGRPTAASRPRQQRATPRAESATPSTFRKQDRDPVEEYCLSLLLSYPELEEEAAELQPEYFSRLENREIFNQWRQVCQGRQDDTVLASLQQSIDNELAEHLESLLQKGLPPLESQRRLAAFRSVIARLEGRYLRERKIEEELRFAEATPDLLEQSNQEILTINQRIKRNQSMRNWLAQNVTRRG